MGREENGARGQGHDPPSGCARVALLAGTALAVAASGCMYGGDGVGDPAAESIVSNVTLPGRVQAEDYNTGGEGVGYHDTTSGNAGAQYRADNVDIEVTTDTGGGYDVGWIDAGEWLAYSITASRAGTYAFRARVASNVAGTKTIHLEVDGANVGAVSFAATGGWQVWTDATISNVHLAAGGHTLRVVADTPKLNLNYVDVTLTRADCTVSSKLVSSCGAWWGISEQVLSGETQASALTRIEGQVGRAFDIVHTYHANNQTFPNATEQQWSDEGHLLLINWKPSNAVNGWAIAASGSIDATIAQAAVNVRTFGRPLFLALYHEPENNLPGGSDTQAGTAADYVAMWRHVRQVFDQNHATNVVWVWDMMGFSGHAAHYLSGDLYPGDAYVDWIAYDPYNSSTGGSSWRTFAQATNGTASGWPGFYTWATTTHPDKPLMLAEYGTNESTTDADAKAQWFLDELAALETSRSAIRAAVYFDLYNWPITSSAASLSAFSTIGHDPYVNQSHE